MIPALWDKITPPTCFNFGVETCGLICQYLFGTVKLVHGYEQDKICQYTVTTSHPKMEEEPTFETLCMSDVRQCSAYVCDQI